MGRCFKKCRRRRSSRGRRKGHIWKWGAKTKIKDGKMYRQRVLYVRKGNKWVRSKKRRPYWRIYKDKGQRKGHIWKWGRKPNLKTVRCTASVSFMSEKEISGCDQKKGGRTGGYTNTKDGKITFGSGGQKPNLKTVRCTAS